MKTPYKLFFVLVVSTLLGTVAKAEIHTIVAEGTSFTPATLNVLVGDTVRWIRNSGTHTTTSTDIPSGANAWDQPLNSTTSDYMYAVLVAGVYNYKCIPHESLHMTGIFTATLTSTPKPVANGLVDVTTTQGIISIINNTTEPVNVTIMDLGGKIVGTFEASTLLTSYFVGDIPKGLYLVNMRNNGHYFSRKISIN